MFFYHFLSFTIYFSNADFVLDSERVVGFFVSHEVKNKLVFILL